MVALPRQHNILDFPEPVQVHGKQNDEWYTSPKYIEAAREVMGGIDLDPASCIVANQIVKATRFFTKDDNGLTQDWTCKSMWLNPPYGRVNGKGASVIKMFVMKLLHEYRLGKVKQATMLVTVRTDASWFVPLWEYPICFSDHLLHFFKPSRGGVVFDGQWGHFFGTAFVYLGPNEQKFIDTFSQFGRIARAIDTPKPSPVNLSLWNGGEV